MVDDVIIQKMTQSSITVVLEFLAPEVASHYFYVLVRSEFQYRFCVLKDPKLKLKFRSHLYLELPYPDKGGCNDFDI